VDKQTFHEALH